jgi:hypothetical protein
MINTEARTPANQTPPANTLPNAVKKGLQGAALGFGLVKVGGWLGGHSFSLLGSGVNYYGGWVNYFGNKLGEAGSWASEKATYGVASRVALMAPVQALLSYVANKIAGDPEPHTLLSTSITMATGTAAFQITGYLQPLLANYLFPSSTDPSTIQPAKQLEEQPHIAMTLMLTFLVPQLFVVAHHLLQGYLDRDDMQKLNADLKVILSKVEHVGKMESQEAQSLLLLEIIQDLDFVKKYLARIREKPGLKEGIRALETVMGKIEEGLRQVIDRHQIVQCRKSLNEMKELVLAIARLEGEETAQVREALRRNTEERGKHLKTQLEALPGSEEMQKELETTLVSLNDGSFRSQF